MASTPRYPSLFQINTRVWLQRLSREAGKPITLADIDDATIAGFAEQGFDWIWLLSVWQTGAAGRAVPSRNGAPSSRRFCRTGQKMTSAALVSQSPPTPSARR
jgi:hypothetical protein